MSGDLLHVEETLWVWASSTGLATYDFRFDHQFACRRPWRLEEPVVAVARAGAAEEYAARYEELRAQNVRLIHSPEQYERASLLPAWYPLLEDLTPRSEWHDDFPPASEVAHRFGWPVFVKGERQTSRHRAATSVIRSVADYERVREAWRHDPILAWQRIVLREFVPLRPASPDVPASNSPHSLPASFEFRTFFWRGELVGFGPYWRGVNYSASDAERAAAVAVAAEAARRVDVPFLVVDVAQAADGRWLVIECNDGQDSGYAALRPLPLWRRVLDAEAARGASADV